MPEAIEQMPRMLRHLDDQRGIAWRVRNRVRRMSPTRSAKFMRAFVRPVHFERPVFVLGVPRSGTTMLFHLLRHSAELGALPYEGHDIWRAYHHPRRSGWRSDAIGAGQVGMGERRFVNACFASHFDERRFVEKTPENSLRVPYLLDLFPDAHFVVVHRDPMRVLASLAAGWRDPAGRYRSYFVPEDLDLDGYAPRRRWCFALVEGWRELGRTTIANVVVAQWEQCVNALAAARVLVEPQRWLEVHLDDMVNRPTETLERICRSIAIEPATALHAELAVLRHDPVNALLGVGADVDVEEFRPFYRRVAAVAPSIGYSVDVTNGVARRTPVGRGPRSS